MKPLAIILAVLLWLPLPALAATKVVPTPTPKPTAAATAGKLTAAQVQTNPLLLIQQFSLTDLQAALTDATGQTPADTIAAACWSALIAVVGSPMNNPLPASPGIFQAIQKVRDAKALLAGMQSPTGQFSTVNAACAPIVLNINNTLLALGIGTGLVIGTGGLALPTLPGLLGLLPLP